MSYPIPQILYNPGSGTVTLAFTYPPIQKGMLDDLEALRHDSISSSGIRQTVVERVDTIIPLQMENVLWDDLPAWKLFINFAIIGGTFDYYPDAALPDFTTCELMDTDFGPRYNARNLSKFSLKLRVIPS